MITQPLYAVARWLVADDTLETTVSDIRPMRDAVAAHAIAYHHDRLARRHNGNDPCEGWTVLYWLTPSARDGAGWYF
jgi:hypothetical protein